MKKVKVIVAAILRGALLISPCCAFGWWAWGKAPALIAILASMCVEMMFLIVFSFIAMAIQARKDLKRQCSEEAETTDTTEE